MWTDWNVAQKIFFLIAAPATVLLIVQIVMMLIGFGSGGDADADCDCDVDCDCDCDVDVSDGGEVLDADHGFGLFTVRGLIAFFTVGGWVGYTLSDNHVVLAVILALASGGLALVLMGLLLKWLTSLQSNGNLRYDDAIGLIGDVYLTVPPKDNGKGKINVLLNERLTELSAVQTGEAPIQTGKKVKIIGVIADSFLVEEA